ncbi:DUF1850 domain-containing protein [uncultured Jannaschia sp.]|uniref:DUF1850 domain-containing protein n=1 Tax=uncultured Jannaschia sp. TaxID=293347 RepID=UPI0026368FC0|nr:DUF1850 domain-containing protein [uncultured Jannaschia sp.]
MLGATFLHLAAPDFTLRWTHSVERTDWVERWTVADDRLRLRDAAVRGSGAGMEPGADAVLRDGWWVSPGGLEVPALHLAASGETGGGWTLCADGTCREIGAAAGAPLRLAPCANGTAD